MPDVSSSPADSAVSITRERQVKDELDDLLGKSSMLSLDAQPKQGGSRLRLVDDGFAWYGPPHVL